MCEGLVCMVFFFDRGGDELLELIQVYNDCKHFVWDIEEKKLLST